MDAERLLLANLNSALLLVLIVGLVARKRYRLCWSFAAYVLLVFLSDRLIIGWPERFDTWRFWLFKETLYWCLKLAVAAEIGLLTFSQLPRVRRFFAAGLAVLAAAAALAQLAPAAPRPGDELVWVSIASPRGQASILVVFAAVVGLAAHYRIPVHPFHRGILLGFGLYLVVYTGTLTMLREWGVAFYPWFQALDPAAYASTVGVWAWTAWRRVPELTAGARRLQPWATST